MIKIIIDDVLGNENAFRLNRLMMILGAALVLRAFFSFLRTYMSGLLGEHLVLDLRSKVYDHIPKLSLKSVNKISPAQILSRITQDVDSMRRFLFSDAVECIYALFSFMCISVIIFSLSVKLAAVSLLVLPLFVVLYFRLIPEFKHKYSLYREMIGRLSARTSEFLNGIRIVRSFNRTVYEKKIFDENQNQILNIASGTHCLNSWLWAGVEFFTSMGVLGVLWIGGSDCLSGRITAGELVAFYTYLGMLFAPILRLISVNASYQEASAAMERINSMLIINDEVVSRQILHKLPNIKGRIDIKDVTFKYNHDRDVLKNISFFVDPGEIVGIAGASGVGKTTLINLLLRFYDPNGGRIFIDGCDLKHLDVSEYRRQIGIVWQDDFLFKGTIADNIRYGRLEASLEEIMGAAKSACAHEFIDAFPQGYETMLEERGVNLSSGQRQRVAIARALIKNPSILILDEATSAVDALTENKIQKSIRGHMKGKTVFIVAHRFSTIMEADKIIILDQGKIVETGNHNYLLKKQGYYSSLYLEQFKKEEVSSFENIV